jgi:hypothetical protein
MSIAGIRHVAVQAGPSSDTHGDYGLRTPGSQGATDRNFPFKGSRYPQLPPSIALRAAVHAAGR